MTTSVKPIEVKKLENGTCAFRFSNNPEVWVTVDEEIFAQYLILKMITG